MFKKIKVVIIPIVVILLMAVGGVIYVADKCSFIAQYNQDWMASYVACAIAEEDSSAVWDSLSPVTQEEFLRRENNDHRRAERSALNAAQRTAARLGFTREELSSDEGARKRLANKLKNSDMFIKIDGRWYLSNRN